MKLKRDRLLEVFSKLKQVKEHPKIRCADPAFIPVDINDLIAVIGEISENFIEVREVDFDAVHTRGMVERYVDKKVKISIRRSLTDDLKNLTAAKELCHVLVDREEDFSPKGHETINLFLEAFNNPAKDFDENHLQSEFIADFAAWEILYPFEYRENDIKAIAEGRETPKSLSIKYDVPEFVISNALRPTYHDYFSKIWKEC